MAKMKQTITNINKHSIHLNIRAKTPDDAAFLNMLSTSKWIPASKRTAYFFSHFSLRCHKRRKLYVFANTINWFRSDTWQSSIDSLPLCSCVGAEQNQFSIIFLFFVFVADAADVRTTVRRTVTVGTWRWRTIQVNASEGSFPHVIRNVCLHLMGGWCLRRRSRFMMTTTAAIQSFSLMFAKRSFIRIQCCK